MEVSSLLPSLKSRPLTQSSQTSPIVALLELIHSNFSLGTWMLLGACTQATLALLVRNKYHAFLPAAILLSFRIIDALLIHFPSQKEPVSGKRNSQKEILRRGPR